MVIRDIPYATDRHPRLVGDLYLPDQAADAPVALVIHGGGWLNSDKSSITPVCQVMAEIGFGAFSINYRRLTEAPWPACWDDCLAALSRLRNPDFLTPYGLTARQVVVSGASAGGHLALMTALSRPVGEVDAILTIAPPTALEIDTVTSDEFLFTWDFYRMFFGRGDDVTESALFAASPLGLVSESSPPLWLVHSKADLLVPPAHGEWLVQAYQDRRRSVREYWFEGLDPQHGLWKDNAAAHREMTAPFEQALRPALLDLRASLSR